ncbi:AarF/ABC1/UbiB kinase family protein [Pyruvatibacter mobilis]|uniref:AarF/ABC1/UbiB kinase family protein n=1 Tax=Pyruvatibacter mobilis TaxID=1712261 RepID=A0A845QE93_9HYPH|nr:AarF/ABC1/UbiB kinase family protein [Pyruvatibacter mobilis]NBG96767.1 AarF/ABC1/UbiB kinase family protein [Pyruvatibacter mobilis]QJD74241.1 AarF/ABC1/UbiB kinase family protein [Pyruvatibacter mobilis]GGD05254.1 ABC transporter ATP-binding protein [Pyruvatibacter mobilis]
MADGPKTEENRLSGRARRYARVGGGVGGIAAKMAGARLFGLEIDDAKVAAELKDALGGMKGPIMKVAQMLATIPDVLPEDYAMELAQLQANAPPMGWPFVKRRMASELGAGWQKKFGSFERDAAAAASLGQVHRAVTHDGVPVACKLQYPDMQSAVEADLTQLEVVFAIQRRVDGFIDTRQMANEIGARLREELDYTLEARHIGLYQDMLADDATIRVPEVIDDLSTKRLLTMTWLDGAPLLDFRQAPLEVRNDIASAMFRAWWHPFSHFGAIHGDPHLGNYTVREDHGINLLDYGCIRKFPPAFVAGVVELYRGLQTDDRDRVVAAYESWGFENLTNDLVDILNIWATFIYGPLLDDRVRTIADGISPGKYGRQEAAKVHAALKSHGPVTPPKEFVFMDRAAVGLGGVFLHLAAELNFHDLFNAEIDKFNIEDLAARQLEALEANGLELAP